ncbi:hypothetical protein Q6346_01100 [Isoptericola sp. b490]|uniref:hypothetical protein n=1 Tax=Actinotalea lenta TaxID=3064654 RepID=UPI002712A249|nr:hypothetical protein [Isoptericola sp. b490]MDO8119906.1 hypothetical protein [Isoptericola sp. b490]
MTAIGPVPGTEREGLRYGGLVVHLDGVGRDAVVSALSAARFSGWVGPDQTPWLVVVAATPFGPVAGSRTGIAALADRLADRLGTLVLAVQVIDDQVLRLFWSGPDGAGRYDSDPTVGHEDDDELSDDPEGVELLTELAAACGRPDAGEDLTDLLDERIDRDSTYESERLRAALRLLGMPTWLMASASLPRDVPGGPRRRELTRLGAGRGGVRGRVRGALVGRVRRHRRPRPS